MNPFERFFFGEYGAARAYLVSRSVLLLLALDTWMLMIGHAGRYGIGGFNVAHFGWLDALQPVPTPALYIGVLLLAGVLALVMLLTGMTRAGALVLFLLYTFSWSMSMLDSYQHHYFVSLVLLCMVFFPATSALALQPVASIPSASPKADIAPVAAVPLDAWGALYAAAILGAVVAYGMIDVEDHSWTALLGCGGAIAALTAWYRPQHARARAPLMQLGFGFNLLGATIAVVYAFTAIAKMEQNWVQGHTLLRISSVARVFAGVADLAERVGLPRDRLWSIMATLVIPQELALGGCYLLAVRQDRLRARWVRVVCALGFGMAIVLHGGAEVMNLQIGWFSYYMLLLAAGFLLPLPIVDRLVTVFTWPARHGRRLALAWQAEGRSPMGAIVLAFATCGMLVLIGTLIDLPGAVAACAIAGTSLVAVTGWLLVRAPQVDPRPGALATAVAALSLWGAIAASPVRWDFYRFLAGDLKRRQATAAALRAYEHSERYAPAGKSRANTIEQLRKELARP